MSYNSISKRNIILLGLVLLVAVIGGFFVKSYSAPDGQAENGIASSTSAVTPEQQSDNYKQYRESLYQALKLQREASLSESEKASWETFKSEKYGFQFQYPKGYLIMGGKELDPSENAGAVFSFGLTPDTEHSRSYLAEESPDLEPPASMGVIIYQKDASKKELPDFVPTIITEEEKEVPGIYEKTTVSGQAGLVYTISTIYEYDIVISGMGNYIYKFSVGYTRPEDVIRQDFYRLLSTVTFN